MESSDTRELNCVGKFYSDVNSVQKRASVLQRLKGARRTRRRVNVLNWFARGKGEKNNDSVLINHSRNTRLGYHFSARDSLYIAIMLLYIMYIMCHCYCTV